MNDENFQEGAFIVSRSIFKSDIWEKPPEFFKLWAYIVGKANHADRKYRGFEVKRGQYFCTQRELTEQLRYYRGYCKEKAHESRTKHLMKFLRETGRITTTKRPRGTLITVLHYNEYQDLKNYVRTRERTTERTRSEPGVNQECPSINNNEKNEKNEKNSTQEELREMIINELSRYKEIDNPEGYLRQIESKASPVAIERAWKNWKRGGGITSPDKFRARCFYYAKQDQDE